METAEILKYCLKEGKAVYCPRVTGKEMDFYRISAVEELAAGFHGILEPPGAPERLFRPGKKALMVMPGVVFDRQHHRIGYGGGYYDRYLQGLQGIVTAALAFSFQVVEEIPAEPHDIRPQIILTEDCEI